MVQSIILAQSGIAAMALEQVLLLAARDQSENRPEVRRIVWDVAYLDLAAFRQLARILEEAAANEVGDIPLHEIIVLVDSVDLSLLNPIRSGGWENIVAMLILAFPEFRWVFGVMRGGSNTKSIEEAHGLSSLFRDYRDPLFDASGLRQWVRALAINDLAQAAYLPLRRQRIVAIDDESEYCYTHAYVAYRFGFRADVVTSFAQMADLFHGTRYSHDLCVATFEDIGLNFPGRTKEAVTLPNAGKEIRLSQLRERDQLYPGLRQVLFRVFVSTGRTKADDELWEDNQEYLEAWEAEVDGRTYKFLWKPLAGIFNLWKDSGLLSWVKTANLRRNVDVAPEYLALGPDFHWPPAREMDLNIALGHSAPDKLLEIGNHLLRRASRLLERTPLVTDAVHGAVLATDALECFGNRVPTTGLHALALKHQFEAMAECCFYGVDYNKDIKTRLVEISREVRAISRWFHARRRKHLRLNAELELVRQLTLIFRNHNQFDEEQQCLTYSRDLHRKLWFSKHPMALPFMPVAWYIGFLLASIPRFVGCLCGWVLLLAIAFHVSETAPWGASASGQSVASFGTCLQKSIETCFSLQAVNPPFAVLNEIGIVVAFLHLGVFIAHLYGIVTRR